MRVPGGAEQIDERLHLSRSKVPQLLQVALAHRLFQLLQQRQTRVGDTHLHHSAIVGHPLPGDQAPLLQPIDQPGDVRGM